MFPSSPLRPRKRIVKMMFWAHRTCRIFEHRPTVVEVQVYSEQWEVSEVVPIELLQLTRDSLALQMPYRQNKMPCRWF